MARALLLLRPSPSSSPPTSSLHLLSSSALYTKRALCNFSLLLLLLLSLVLYFAYSFLPLPFIRPPLPLIFLLSRSFCFCFLFLVFYFFATCSDSSLHRFPLSHSRCFVSFHLLLLFCSFRSARFTVPFF